MHRTLKHETARPPGMNSLQQQARFDDFVREFNDGRLAGGGIPFPRHGHPRHRMRTHRRICMHRKKINVSTVLAGQRLGIKEVDNGIWLVGFLHYDLGYIDLEQRTLQTIDNPFGTRLSLRTTPCLRYILLPMSPGRTWGKMVAEERYRQFPHLPEIRYSLRLFSRLLAA